MGSIDRPVNGVLTYWMQPDGLNIKGEVMEKIKVLLKCVYELYGEEFFAYLDAAAKNTDTPFDDYAVTGLKKIAEWLLEDEQKDK